MVRRVTLAGALLLVIAVPGLAGCSGGSGDDPPALALEGNPTRGKAVWSKAGCYACHTLADAGAKGTVGPNLDRAKPSFELVVRRVTDGKAGMPTFAGQLEPQEIADVAQYVADATAG
jgi:mono/diheme cytochrome c family protein